MLLRFTEKSRVDLVPTVMAAGDWVVVAERTAMEVVGDRMGARPEQAVGAGSEQLVLCLLSMVALQALGGDPAQLAP